MARFDVFHFANKSAPLVVDVQADLLSALATRVVIPLTPLSQTKEALPRLKPVLEIGGAPYVLMTTDIAALPLNRLGSFVANIEDDYRKEITDALDFLLLGF
ncbi:MAG: CcdB family protein [Pseudomonadota bacterium]